jgi:glucuronokinase
MNVSSRNIRMIELARATGASAKFTGSGGAIIGLYHDEKMFQNLRNSLQSNRISVIKPRIVQKIRQ